jgi:hypothetical protein
MSHALYYNTCPLYKLFNGLCPLKKDASLYEVMSRLAESNYPLIDKLCEGNNTYARHGLPAEQRREPPPHALRSYLAVGILGALCLDSRGGNPVKVVDASVAIERYIVQNDINGIAVAADTFVKLMSPRPVGDVRHVALLLHVALRRKTTRVSVIGYRKFVPLAMAELVALREKVEEYVPYSPELMEHATF